MKNYFWVNAAAVLVFVFLSGHLLINGKPFLLPLIVAIVLWYLVISFTEFYQMIGLKLFGFLKLQNFFPQLQMTAMFEGQNSRKFIDKIKTFKLLYPVSMALALMTWFFLFWVMAIIIDQNLGQIVQKSSLYNQQIIALSEKVSDYLSVDISKHVRSFLQQIELDQLAKGLFGFTKQSFLVLILLFFLLIEHKLLIVKFEALASTREKREEARKILSEIKQDINLYAKVKTASSLATALLCWGILVGFGVDFAAFWAIIIFLLNFIPTIGSFIAVLFPTIIAFLQLDAYLAAFCVSLLVLTQIIIGNFIEPRYMGSSLNISPLVIILSLSFWASLWGVLGMLLCVPIAVITNIVCSKFPSTKFISILLSGDGAIRSRTRNQ